MLYCRRCFDRDLNMYVSSSSLLRSTVSVSREGIHRRWPLPGELRSCRLAASSSQASSKLWSTSCEFVLGPVIEAPNVVAVSFTRSDLRTARTPCILVASFAFPRLNANLAHPRTLKKEEARKSLQLTNNHNYVLILPKQPSL